MKQYFVLLNMDLHSLNMPLTLNDFRDLNFTSLVFTCNDESCELFSGTVNYGAENERYEDDGRFCWECEGPRKYEYGLGINKEPGDF